jgi:hypothetical protein
MRICFLHPWAAQSSRKGFGECHRGYFSKKGAEMKHHQSKLAAAVEGAILVGLIALAVSIYFMGKPLIAQETRNIPTIEWPE